MRHFAATSLLLAGLTGCSLIPTYHRPALPVAAQYPDAPTTGAKPATGMPAADIGWRDFFTDPVEQELIVLSLANNRDLRIAVLNVAGAQAQY